MTKFDPTNYRKTLNRQFILHGIESVFNLTACILCLYNNFFASSIFSKTLEREFLDNKNKNARKEFNIIAYTIYGALIIGVHLFYLALYCLRRCSDANTNNTDIDTDQENEKLITKYTTPLLILTNKYAPLLEIPANDILIYFHRNEDEFAYTYYFMGCHRRIHFSTGFLKLVEQNKASLELTLAHELIHLKRDSPLFINDAVSWIQWATQKLLRLYQLPIQAAYFIAGSIVFGFQPACAYSLGITFILSVMNGFTMPHRNRLKESRADFESLFGQLPFSEGEHQKQIEFFYHLEKKDNEASCVTKFWIDYLRKNTHPPYQDRIDMTYAALEQHLHH